MTATRDLAGREDALCPPGFHDEIAGALAGSRREQLDAGHLVPLERPVEFGALVRDWRAGVDAETLGPRSRAGRAGAVETDGVTESGTG